MPLNLWIVILEKTLDNPLDGKEVKSIHPKGNQPKYSLEGLMLKLKLQYYGHLTWRADALKKTLMLGKVEGRRRGRQRMRWLDGITDSVNKQTLGERGTGKPSVLQSMGSQKVKQDLATEKQEGMYQSLIATVRCWTNKTSVVHNRKHLLLMCWELCWSHLALLACPEFGWLLARQLGCQGSALSPIPQWATSSKLS